MSNSVTDDLIAQIMDDEKGINAISYGEVLFAIQDGRMVMVKYTVTKRVGKEITRQTTDKSERYR